MPAATPAGPKELSRSVEVRDTDLPLHCPPPDTPLWRMHPRVFLDVSKAGEVLCPYCGTRYVYAGTPPRGHG
jgi:uncharacterized Zn-finger protein